MSAGVNTTRLTSIDDKCVVTYSVYDNVYDVPHDRPRVESDLHHRKKQRVDSEEQNSRHEATSMDSEDCTSITAVAHRRYAPCKYP